MGENVAFHRPPRSREHAEKIKRGPCWWSREDAVSVFVGPLLNCTFQCEVRGVLDIGEIWKTSRRKANVSISICIKKPQKEIQGPKGSGDLQGRKVPGDLGKQWERNFSLLMES